MCFVVSLSASIDYYTNQDDMVKYKKIGINVFLTQMPKAPASPTKGSAGARCLTIHTRGVATVSAVSGEGLSCRSNQLRCGS